MLIIPIWELTQFIHKSKLKQEEKSYIISLCNSVFFMNSDAFIALMAEYQEYSNQEKELVYQALLHSKLLNLIEGILCRYHQNNVSIPNWITYCFNALCDIIIWDEQFNIDNEHNFNILFNIIYYSKNFQFEFYLRLVIAIYNSGRRIRLFERLTCAQCFAPFRKHYSIGIYMTGSSEERQLPSRPKIVNILKPTLAFKSMPLLPLFFNAEVKKYFFISPYNDSNKIEYIPERKIHGASYVKFFAHDIHSV